MARAGSTLRSPPDSGGCTASVPMEAHRVGWPRSSRRSRATPDPPRSVFGPSRLSILVPAGTTASADSCRVHGVVAAAAAGSACHPVPAPRQASPHKNGRFPPTTVASTQRSLGGGGLRRVLPAHPGPPRLTGASCSSVQGFASTGFLRTPPRDGALACGYGWHHLLPTGLSPASDRPWWAYSEKGRPGWAAPSVCLMDQR